VLVAMSGGVDSSLAAALLVEAGCDVVGAFIGGMSPPAAGRHADDARRVADKLGIKLHVLDLADAFEPILREFAAEYARGRTPNPCVHCNRLIKFGRLAEHADRLGARYLATGHYARVVRLPGGGAAIARARSRRKDQSYALFAVDRAVLERVRLPIGELEGKEAVREAARRRGLDVHGKPDSQDICFLAGGDYVPLLRRLAPEALRGGEIASASGEVVGRHEGYARFTIGQRRGLGVAAGEAMYVTGIDAATARVTIGPRGATMSTALVADAANWHADVAGSFQALVQVRSAHAGARARVRVTGERTFEARFERPVHAVTPGQAAVVYDGERLLGGGWIRQATGRPRAAGQRGAG
jgi:tRNA-specific 2-thiouridylase